MFYLDSTVGTAIHLFHLMNKAGIVSILQREPGKDVINRKNWQENSLQQQV